jgi:transketolase
MVVTDKLRNNEELKIAAREIRLDILKMAFDCKGPAHLGGGLSMVDLMTSLYSNFLHYDSSHPDSEDRDRFILSKGHGVLGYFPVLSYFGFFDKSTLSTFKQNGSDLVAHPVWNQSLGIESSNGSLGHGLSLAAGISLASKLKNKNFRTYVLLGDGECNEGSVWEAAMFAVHYGLDSLTAIIDWNGFQSDGATKDVMGNSRLPLSWKGFGWNVIEIDGHSFEEINGAFSAPRVKGVPTVIIARTVKGKGVSFMENNNVWHHNRLTEEAYLRSIDEIRQSV